MDEREEKTASNLPLWILAVMKHGQVKTSKNANSRHKPKNWRDKRRAANKRERQARKANR